MLNYKQYLELMSKYHLITPVWSYVLEMLSKEINEEEKKDPVLSLFAIYFSLVDDGNLGMKLEKAELLEKCDSKLKGARAQFDYLKTFDEEEFASLEEETKDLIRNHLKDITEGNLPKLIGNEHKVFQIEDGWLYAQKYNIARKGVDASLSRIFKESKNVSAAFDYKTVTIDGFKLTDGQEKAATEGLKKNLIVTGGPGTGKTTSILFLILAILKDNPENEVYLCAPSGKASSRMKESILKGKAVLKQSFIDNNADLINRINNLEEYTIHRLLGVQNEGGFEYNKNKMFGENSVFVIDEASMIDVTMFNALLEAIPENARVFIMGDKNQLPSVECGSVFASLLKKESLKDFVVELDESKRFSKDTEIYKLAEIVNNGESLDEYKNKWNEYTSFEIKPSDSKCPIFFYEDSKKDVADKDIITHISKIWAKQYFEILQKEATGLKEDDFDSLKHLVERMDDSRILSTENEGPRGIKEINRIIKKASIDRSVETTVAGHYAGELMMINKNNKLLDLYNGDSGILVLFEGDDTLYFMTKKSSSIVSTFGKKKDEIFKLGDDKDSYVFYPLRMISTAEIDLSYAITVHKSQGSDYKNILVILPKKKGHPLLNRQIVYTAITRTKGNTYILSNQELLEEAKDTVLERDTNI